HLLATHDIHPHHLTGHSIGEITAAHTAGILSLTDAAILVTTRAWLMQNITTPGLMISINAPHQSIRDILRNHPGIDIAAHNSPTHTVISGDTQPTRDAADELTAHGHHTRPLHTSHAFHSHHLDTILDQFHHTTSALTYHPPRTRWPFARAS
ncbi:acyltransferase domain-containing protein, partial [Parafrankia sp. Ea1.12]|uniref:acyltransferase domain-containing protein n=1 Tax=Parafrankia sp. Ea1.12 TaxID=573499 RepID=UPI00135A9BA3